MADTQQPTRLQGWGQIMVLVGAIFAIGYPILNISKDAEHRLSVIETKITVLNDNSEKAAASQQRAYENSILALKSALIEFEILTDMKLSKTNKQKALAQMAEIKTKGQPQLSDAVGGYGLPRN